MWVRYPHGIPSDKRGIGQRLSLANIVLHMSPATRHLRLAPGDRIGILHPSIDACRLGLASMERLLSACGIVTVSAGPEVNDAALRAEEPACARIVRDWIKGAGLTALGYSSWLDPEEGLRLFASFMGALHSVHALASEGGGIRTLFFAGLPRTCELVGERFPQVAALFRGEESPSETLELLGLPVSLLPAELEQGFAYDEGLMSFGRALHGKGDYRAVPPLDRSGYSRFGQRGDGIAARVAHGVAHGFPPVMRAQVGPWLPDGKAAVALLLDWTSRLARAGLLDVLSIGTSRLSQDEFGGEWEGSPDSGGTPIHSPQEFSEIWRAARPMLVRSDPGPGNAEATARMLEERIDNAWHALSLWWPCRLDGRGPGSVAENLRQQLAALRYIAGTSKPFEPTAPSDFARRGGDDLTYVLSGLVAAKAAKAAGVQRLVLQVPLDTHRSGSGLNDLAKARSLLHLARELEDGDFKVYLQPRAGPDFLSRDPDRARAQLAAVTAMMDDIEPGNSSSPEMIHVAGCSEAPADPDLIDESVRITRQALIDYRALRASGSIEDMSSNRQVLARTAELIRETRLAVAGIESSIASPWGAEGLYEIMASGFFAAPHLEECREEFSLVVDAEGRPLPARDRIAAAVQTARERAGRAFPKRS
jgi:hypothetical protein